MISQDELSERLKITRSSAAVHISNLMRKGRISGRGYIFDERNSIVVVGHTWLEIRASADRGGKSGNGWNKIGKIWFECAGNGCLVALELARRHQESTLITFLGKDEIGDQIYNHLLHEGIRLHHGIRSVNDTRKRLVLLGSDSVTRQIEDEGGSLALGLDAVSSKEELIRAAKILLIDGDLPGETLSYLASMAINHGIVSSTVGCSLELLREHKLLCHPQFYLVCTASDLVAQLHVNPANEPEELFPACRQIVGEGCSALIAIYSDQGLILATAEETVFLPASPLQAPGNELGVTAGIADGLASGYKMRMAVRMAMGSGQ